MFYIKNEILPAFSFKPIYDYVWRLEDQVCQADNKQQITGLKSV